jgi:hypothetical protein
MKSLHWIPALILLSGVCLAPSTVFGAEGAQPKTWQQKMRGLEQSLKDLLFDLGSNERFNDPKNFKRIQKNADALAALAHDLKIKDGDAPDADPSIKIIAGQFDKEAGRAAQTLKLGHREYARGVLKSLTSYCMACHTRSGGLSFGGALPSDAFQKFTPLEKAAFFTATRQFDRSLEEYELILAKSKPDGSIFDWEKALRSSLAIAVRVKKDPDRSLSLVERALSNPNSPYFLKEQATQWKASIEKWKAEPSQKAQTEAGYYAQALRLMSQAKELQKYPADRSADVLYLRASSAVHDLMSFAPNGAHATEALYLAGLSYEVLRDLKLADIHEVYYLACVNRSPHTEIAQRCYRQYEQSVYFGYTGSSGTHLPAEIQKQLRELETLAQPKQEITP